MIDANLRPILSLLLGVALLLAGAGLQITLLPLRASTESFGTFAIGAIGSAYYLGFVVGCILGPFVILRSGHIRAFSALVAVAATMALLHALIPLAPVWAAIRFVTGFCLAGFYLVIESWLNDRSSNETRGKVMSAYVVVNFAAIAAGQMIVTTHPVEGATLFMIAAILSALAIVPVALTRSAQPAPITIVRFQPRVLWQAAPVALAGSFMVGLSLGAFWTLAPAAIELRGANVAEVAAFMTAAVIAGALMQYPAGRLSDRIDRRRVLLGLLGGSMMIALALWLYAGSGWILLTLACFFGALALPGYSIAAAHGYDRTQPEEMVATSATILLANGLGSIAGPVIAAGLMRALGPSALFLFVAVSQLALAGFVIHRMRVQAPVEPEAKAEFDLASTAPVGAVVPTEELKPESPEVIVPEGYAPEPPNSP
ncbi:MAG: MFS transporter [Xanthobacteraceae bacterium]|nr:MFS transporter [Xanthobacteraceae bacterium]